MRNLDLMSTNDLVDLFLKEEISSLQNLKKQKKNIAKAINLIRKKIKNKGRIFYIGSGTSGRLGVLDATECKPTFSTNLFKAIIAGGKNAIFQAKEGIEDNTKQGVKDLKKSKITKNDLVIGISASGETPYTVSVLKYAKKLRIQTISITSNPYSTLSKIARISISPEIKEEIISGSTRLKSGTIQKIILNMLSSISMIKNGKVYGNLMTDVEPKNKKLINRAIGIISSICKVPLNKARSLFLKSKKNLKAAVVMHFKGCSLKSAMSMLEKKDFNLRKIVR